MFVYVLKSITDGSQYVGMSASPDERLKAHNCGEVSSTQHKRPWIRIHLEKYSTIDLARKREKYLKSAAGRRFRAKLSSR